MNERATKDGGLPSQKDLEKEIGDYLSEKYGSRVKIVSAGLFPEPQPVKGEEPKDSGGKDPAVFNFRMTPEELIGYLDEYVVCQDEAKAVLATKICTHFNRIRFSFENGGLDRRSIGQVKNNVLLIGPTGVGKTFLIKLIARKLGVPFVKGDATKFSETGYVGGDVEDLVRDLVRQAGGDIEKASYGIIYVDEVDKITASRNLAGHDISRTGVQRALLKPMEETTVDMKVSHDPISQMEAMEYFRTHGERENRTINTRNILFIMSGSFSGLDDIIRKRVGRQSIGFESAVTARRGESAYLKDVKAEDLISYGFESEFVGRLPVLTVLDRLTEDDLYEILKSPNSTVIMGKKKDFRSYGIKVIFEDDSLREIARLAVLEKTGARGLQSVLERSLLPFERKLPSGRLSFLVVSGAMIRDPVGSLELLLTDPDQKLSHRARYRRLAEAELAVITRFLEKSPVECYHCREIAGSPDRLGILARFCQTENLDSNDACEIFIEMIRDIRECEDDFSRPEMKITFGEDAIDRILAKSPRNRRVVRAICKRVVDVCDYGLRLISRKIMVPEVIISAEAIDDPERYINDLVATKFSREQPGRE